MSSVERSVLFPSDEFRYPAVFDVARYKQFQHIDEDFFERKTKHRFVQHIGNHGSSISPYHALVRYANSPAGAWHSQQRARYPVLHAELDPEIVDVNDHNELLDLQHTILEAIAHPQDTQDTFPNHISHFHRYGHPGFDLHPIGHMAQVALRLDRLLMLNSASDSINPEPFLLQVIRHTAALHDVGETEFPGVKLHHGAAIGDIGANIGKTDDDRRLEKAITHHVINATFQDVYSEEFSEAVIAMATHDVSTSDRTLRVYHAISEMNHEMNTLSTAAYLGKKGLALASALPLPANVMTALASDSIVRGIKKRDHLIQEGLSLELATVMTEKLRELFWIVADRDSDDSYTLWRTRPAVANKFGLFQPDSSLVRKALD